MSNSERGNFEGGDTITVAELCKQREDTFGYVAIGELRIDNARVVVLPNSVAIHRTPPANPHVKVRREGTGLFGTFHELSGSDDLTRPKRIAGERSTYLPIHVGDGYYNVWDSDLEADLRR